MNSQYGQLKSANEDHRYGILYKKLRKIQSLVCLSFCRNFNNYFTVFFFTITGLYKPNHRQIPFYDEKSCYRLTWTLPVLVSGMPYDCSRREKSIDLFVGKIDFFGFSFIFPYLYVYLTLIKDTLPYSSMYLFPPYVKTISKLKCENNT